MFDSDANIEPCYGRSFTFYQGTSLYTAIYSTSFLAGAMYLNYYSVLIIPHWWSVDILKTALLLWLHLWITYCQWYYCMIVLRVKWQQQITSALDACLARTDILVWYVKYYEMASTNCFRHALLGLFATKSELIFPCIIVLQGKTITIMEIFIDCML